MINPEGTRSADGGSSLNGVILLSLVAHFLVLSLLVFSPSLLPAPKLTFGPVYSVQLVNMPATTRAGKNYDEVATREILDRVSARQPMLSKTVLDPLSVPVTPQETRKKTIDSVEKAVEAIRKNVSPAAEKAAPSPAVQGAPRITSEQASAAAGTAAGDLNIRMRNYYAVIWSRIKGLWTIPPGLLPRENIETVVHVQVLRDGSITNVGLEKRSGNRYFDDSALRTVKKANPLPPLPEELRESSLEIGIRFHSSEFK